MEQLNNETTDRKRQGVMWCYVAHPLVSKAALPEKVIEGHHAKPPVLQDYFSLIVRQFI